MSNLKMTQYSALWFSPILQAEQLYLAKGKTNRLKHKIFKRCKINRYILFGTPLRPHSN